MPAAGSRNWSHGLRASMSSEGYANKGPVPPGIGWPRETLPWVRGRERVTSLPEAVAVGRDGDMWAR